MTTQRRNNPQSAIDSVAESLYRAWSCLHVLQGLHAGAREAPEALQEHGAILMHLWRCTFEVLFVTISSLLESNSGKINLKAMLETLEKHGPATAGPVLGTLRRQLAQDTDARRIKLWRHNAIAHRTDEGRDPEFFVRNKLDVEAAETVLVELEDMLNQASLATTNTYVNVKHGSEDNVLHAKLLLADLGLATRVAASAAQ